MAFILVAILFTACYFLLLRFLHLPHNPKEPPLIPQHIPFIGHLIGMLKSGSGYYRTVTFVSSGRLIRL